MSSYEFKEIAKKILKGKLGVAIIVCLITFIFSNAISFADNALRFKYNLERSETVIEAINKTNNDNWEGRVINKNEKKEDNTEYVTDVEKGIYCFDLEDSIVVFERKNGYESPQIISILSVIFFFLIMPLSVGYSKFTIMMNRGQDVSPAILIKSYDKSIKIVFTNIYKYIMIFLWTLLFIIPGIISVYKYALTDYILADDDENIGISEVVALSADMMKGHKLELFNLQVSFIGWFILSALTANVLYIAYVGPYYNATLASFYDEVKADYNSKIY